MTRPFIKSLAAIAAIILICLTTSCDTILQYPDELTPNSNGPEKDVYLTISLDNTFKFLGEYEYDYVNQEAEIVSRSKPIQAASAQHQLRFTLNAYNSNDKSVHPTPVHTVIFTRPIASDVDHTSKFKIVPGDYRFVMWVDYVDLGSVDDKYYNTTDFSEITLNNDDGHYGSNEYRDAFYGETTVHIPEICLEDIHAEINLVRPMARYIFISNDLREFYDNELTRRRSNGFDAASRAPDLSEYLVRVVYTQYMTCAFNAHTGKPADSRLGVEYYSLISMLDEDRAQLAFDYIFTNGAETSVKIAMEVLYKDGTVVSRMPAFDVPLKRSHQTFVTGKFLTTKSGGAIGINPDFDGEFNIEIK